MAIPGNQWPDLFAARDLVGKKSISPDDIFSYVQVSLRRTLPVTAKAAIVEAVHRYAAEVRAGNAGPDLDEKYLNAIEAAAGN